MKNAALVVGGAGKPLCDRPESEDHAAIEHTMHPEVGGAAALAKAAEELLANWHDAGQQPRTYLFDPGVILKFASALFPRLAVINCFYRHGFDA